MPYAFFPLASAVLWPAAGSGLLPTVTNQPKPSAASPASSTSVEDAAAWAAKQRAEAKAARREANRQASREERAKSRRLLADEARKQQAELAHQAFRAAFGPDQQAAFLELYSAGLTVVQAAVEVGVSSLLVFRRVREDEEFRSSFFCAREANTDHAEDALHRAALDGSVPALLALLRARRPAAWKEGKALQLDVSATVQQKADAVFGELLSALRSLDTRQRVSSTSVESATSNDASTLQ